MFGNWFDKFRVSIYGVFVEFIIKPQLKVGSSSLFGLCIFQKLKSSYR